jgi:hypothetical protein
VLSACSSSTTNIGSLVLPTSNRTIDVVQHRSDSRECVVGVVIQTYSSEGQLLDSKSAHGTALHCRLIETTIEAGSRVGSAAIVARGLVNAAKATKADAINISNLQTQGQEQSQTQTATATGGTGGASGEGGNNGQGNGSDDGVNGGTDNHHDNGDNN